MKRLLIAAVIGVGAVAAASSTARAGTLHAAPAIAHVLAHEATLVDSLASQADGLRPEVLRLALQASGIAADRGLVTRRDLLTVIDYSLPSSQPRLWVFDLEDRRLLYRELVAHGKNSGGDRATSFSNREGSLQTSLGLFVTAGTYVGANGYSLRMRGLDEGVNDAAMSRAIVMHGAPYVSEAAVKALGRLGRSWGCPAVRPAIARKLIDTIRGGSAVFSYYPDEEWLTASAFLKRQAQAGTSIAAVR